MVDVLVTLFGARGRVRRRAYRGRPFSSIRSQEFGLCCRRAVRDSGIGGTPVGVEPKFREFRRGRQIYVDKPITDSHHLRLLGGYELNRFGPAF